MTKQLEIVLMVIMVSLMSAGEAVLGHTFDWTVAFAVALIGISTVVCSWMTTLILIAEHDERKERDRRTAEWRAQHESQSVPVPRACESASEFAARISPHQTGRSSVGFLGLGLVIGVFGYVLYLMSTPAWKPLPGHEPTWSKDQARVMCLNNELTLVSERTRLIMHDSEGRPLPCTVL